MHASRFAFAMAVPRHDGTYAAHFAALAKEVFPERIKQVLGDNGSVFQGGGFAQYAKAKGGGIATLPHCSKMHASNERCNSTIQEAFIDHEQDLPCDGLATFDDRLLDYLDRYDSQRPTTDSTTSRLGGCLQKVDPICPCVVTPYNNLLSVAVNGIMQSCNAGVPALQTRAKAILFYK